jgi:hypothetical protein
VKLAKELNKRIVESEKKDKKIREVSCTKWACACKIYPPRLTHTTLVPAAAPVAGGKGAQAGIGPLGCQLAAGEESRGVVVDVVVRGSGRRYRWQRRRAQEVPSGGRAGPASQEVPLLWVWVRRFGSFWLEEKILRAGLGAAGFCGRGNHSRRVRAGTGRPCRSDEPVLKVGSTQVPTCTSIHKRDPHNNHPTNGGSARRFPPSFARSRSSLRLSSMSHASCQPC